MLLSLVVLAALFHQSRDRIAMKALSIVNGDQPTACRTAVFFVLRFRKSFDAHPADTLQIILHTHLVVTSIPCVHTIDLFTGILFAFETEPGAGVAFQRSVDPGALCEQVGAYPVPGPAPGALAPFQTIDAGEIAAADRAMHAAGRDKLFGIRTGSLHLQPDVRRDLRALLGACLQCARFMFLVQPGQESGDPLSYYQNQGHPRHRLLRSLPGWLFPRKQLQIQHRYSSL